MHTQREVDDVAPALFIDRVDHINLAHREVDGGVAHDVAAIGLLDRVRLLGLEPAHEGRASS